MFAKSYKLKSNNTLKNSEKKHLAQRILEEFPGATEDNVKEIVPVKSNSSCMKVILHSGDLVNVYVVDGAPMVIEDEKGMVPTVCALWKVPQLVPTIIIHTPVLPKVVGGAPLYLPGVVRGGAGRWARGAALAACTQDNGAAALVGRAALDSSEVRLLVAGVCLDTVHVFGDQLCKDVKFSRMERPRLGPAAYPGEDVEHLASDLTQLTVQPMKEEWPSLGPRPAPAPAPAPANAPAPAPAPAPHQPRLIDEEPPQATPADDSNLAEQDMTMEQEDGEDDSGLPPLSDMDALLRWSLLTALKLHGKRMELPLKTNLLYKNYIMASAPPSASLDVKKSSYKKVGKFLEAMQQEGLLEVREIEKGVSALVAVNAAHPLVRAHAVPASVSAPAPAPAAARDDDAHYTPPVIRELYCLTAAVMDLFPGYRKGTALSMADVRSCVQEYVRARNLQARGAVTMDTTLAAVAGRKPEEQVKWDDLMNAISSRLTAATELQLADGSSRVIKSRLEPITMQVATRSGNKKVTLVSNLEAFGFSLVALAHAAQHGAAAACTVTRSPGAKYDQLLIQGDQTHYIAKLLIEKYGLPKKYVDGADKALKKKK